MESHKIHVPDHQPEIVCSIYGKALVPYVSMFFHIFFICVHGVVATFDSVQLVPLKVQEYYGFCC